MGRYTKSGGSFYYLGTSQLQKVLVNISWFAKLTKNFSSWKQISQLA